MRTGIFLTVSSIDRQCLGALIIDRNAPQKDVWRADIILLSILLLALLGKGTDWLLARGERRLLRWSDTFQGTA